MSDSGGWRLWAVTFGGSGMSKVGPGTCGSAAAAILLLVLWILGEQWGGWNVWPWQGVLLAGLIASSAASVALGDWAQTFYGRKDPGSFVLDEVAGICLTMLGQVLRPGWSEGWVILAAFVAFRIFDVWKPWPCHRLEKFPAGWGILADDLAAAVYANLLVQLVMRLVF